MNERDASGDEEYLPPPPPAADAQDPDDGESRIVTATKRRSRTIVILVTVIAAVLLLGTIATNLVLAAGLRAEIGEGRGDSSAAPSASTTPEDTVAPTSAADRPSAGCGDLCTAAAHEIGTAAGDWRLEGDWTDAPNDLGSSDAATAVFGADTGRATVTVLQFPSDDEAAQAALDIRARIGDPTYTEQVFDDGSGTRYDFDGAIVSRVMWHLDARSRPHAPGRLYIVEAPANAADSFADQGAYQLYLALPL
ncbi:hypothetical protein [Microbacterium sp. NPDC091662]|uniref:hypothetical protein n=1 Tax=Microbacterium sp. NPDC091662 TaxID=3364211 RepID=UPI003806E79A